MRVKEEKKKINKARKNAKVSSSQIAKGMKVPQRGWKNIAEEVKAGRGHNLADSDKVVKMKYRKTYL